MLKFKNFFTLVLLLLLLCLSCSKNSASSEENKKSEELTDWETLTDIDGNVYRAIKIGNQWWMGENLKVTRYRNGESIIHETDDNVWTNLTSGAFCAYDNDSSNVDSYGFLYNWYAINDNRKIAPLGWHVPTDAEWKELEEYLGMSQVEAGATGWRGTGEGIKLKASNGWNYNGNGTNESGFSALPGGYRSYFGTFNQIGSSANFWSDSRSRTGHIWNRTLGYSSSSIYRFDGSRGRGFSIRLLKDKSVQELVKRAAADSTVKQN